jgi:crotonobetainyl-CoA:carnitine CoA-transferase CaiB-like acyl-CoA transferase
MDDPQVKARQLLQFVDYPGAPRSVPLASPAVQLSATPPAIRMRAPMLGEHTDEVLREIGFSDDEINALRAGEVV